MIILGSIWLVIAIMVVFMESKSIKVKVIIVSILSILGILFILADIFIPCKAVTNGIVVRKYQNVETKAPLVVSVTFVECSRWSICQENYVRKVKVQDLKYKEN